MYVLAFLDAASDLLSLRSLCREDLPGSPQPMPALPTGLPAAAEPTEALPSSAQTPFSLSNPESGRFADLAGPRDMNRSLSTHQWLTIGRVGGRHPPPEPATSGGHSPETPDAAGAPSASHSAGGDTDGACLSSFLPDSVMKVVASSQEETVHTLPDRAANVGVAIDERCMST